MAKKFSVFEEFGSDFENFSQNVWNLNGMKFKFENKVEFLFENLNLWIEISFFNVLVLLQSNWRRMFAVFVPRKCRNSLQFRTKNFRLSSWWIHSVFTGSFLLVSTWFWMGPNVSIRKICFNFQKSEIFLKFFFVPLNFFKKFFPPFWFDKKNFLFSFDFVFEYNFCLFVGSFSCDFVHWFEHRRRFFVWFKKNFASLFSWIFYRFSAFVRIFQRS